MHLLEYCKSIDLRLFLLINGAHTAFLDPLMAWVSGKLFWIPLYIVVAYVLIRCYRMKSISIFIAMALCIAFSDQAASHLIKPLVHRLRPCHNPALINMIHLVSGCGGKYGFVSSHAANAFAIATFLSVVLESSCKWLKYILFIVAVTVSYSRIYLGVHYPADVVVAALLGGLIGYVLGKLYQKWSYEGQGNHGR